MDAKALVRRAFLKSLGGIVSLPLAGNAQLSAAPMNNRDVVVLLPGITGSVLRRNGRDVWALTAPSAVDTLATLGRNVEALKLQDDPPDTEDLGDGVVATELFPDVHIFPGLWKVDGYSSVMAALQERVSLSRGKNYFEFPYDWRRDNRVAARKLARQAPVWLDQWKRNSGHSDAKLVLVAHSMGGLVAQYFLECLGGWHYARKLITFGTPYRGSLNALDSLVNGYKKTFMGFNVKDLSELLRSFTSVYQLAPRYPCVDPGDGVLQRPFDVGGLPTLDPRRVKAALEFNEELDRAICRNRQSNDYKPYSIHAIVGVDQPTKQSARLKGGHLEFLNEINGEDFTGDRTVPRPSAVPRGCAEDDDRAYDAAALFVPGIHGSLQNIDQVRTQISHVLTAPAFERYRKERTKLALVVDDAFQDSEDVQISCRAGPKPQDVVLTVEAAAGGPAIFERRFTPPPDTLETVSVGQLRPGTYRVILTTVNLAPSDRSRISDVFLVSR